MTLQVKTLSNRTEEKQGIKVSERRKSISLPNGVVEILDKEIISKLGDGYSDTFHNITMN